MSSLFDVVEIEIKNPANKHVMERDLSEDDADAYVKMAVFRRGVETHFYKAVPAGSVKQ